MACNIQFLSFWGSSNTVDINLDHINPCPNPTFQFKLNLLKILHSNALRKSHATQRLFIKVDNSAIIFKSTVHLYTLIIHNTMYTFYMNQMNSYHSLYRHPPTTVKIDVYVTKGNEKTGNCVNFTKIYKSGSTKFSKGWRSQFLLFPKRGGGQKDFQQKKKRGGGGGGGQTLPSTSITGSLIHHGGMWMSYATSESRRRFLKLLNLLTKEKTPST